LPAFAFAGRAGFAVFGRAAAFAFRAVFFALAFFFFGRVAITGFLQAVTNGASADRRPLVAMFR
jgi:hypothetical protein